MVMFIPRSCFSDAERMVRDAGGLVCGIWCLSKSFEFERADTDVMNESARSW